MVFCRPCWHISIKDIKSGVVLAALAVGDYFVLNVFVLGHGVVLLVLFFLFFYRCFYFYNGFTSAACFLYFVLLALFNTDPFIF